MSEHLVERDGVFYFRRRIPRDLRAHFPQGEIRISLKLGKTPANRRAAALAARALSHEWEQRFARLRASIAKQAWTTDELARLADTWVAWRLSDDDAVRRAGYTEAQLDAATEAASRDLERMRRALALGNTKSVEYQLEDFAGACELDLPEAPALRRELALALLRAEVASLETELSRDRGEVVLTPSVPIDAPSTPVLPATRRARSGIRLTGLMDYWAAARGITGKSLSEARKAAREFIEASGDLLVSEIDKTHFIAFRNLMLTQGRSAATVKKYLQLLNAMFNAAADEGQFGIEASPGNRVKVPSTGQTRKPRDAFTAEQLQRLLDTPVFTEGERPLGGKGEAAFFVPLITLFTGRRQAEILQLRTADIEQRDGSLCFVFRHDPAKGQRIKTGQKGQGVVPVHPTLLRLGFERYVSKARHVGHDKLFPEVTSKDAWSKWFNRYLDEAAGLKDSALDFHSGRHTFKHHARACGIAEDIQDAITGHSGVNRVARSYGSLSGYPVKSLAAALKKYKIEGLDFTRLRKYR